jgi:hypothetical protein
MQYSLRAWGYCVVLCVVRLLSVGLEIVLLVLTGRRYFLA